jgi:hypothetical protein
MCPGVADAPGIDSFFSKTQIQGKVEPGFEAGSCEGLALDQTPVLQGLSRSDPERYTKSCLKATKSSSADTHPE